MQRVVRQAGPKGSREWARTRGPFLTESVVFDAGTRPVVVELHGSHMILRQRGRRRGAVMLSYEAAFAFAWKKQMEERARAKKAAKKAGGAA